MDDAHSVPEPKVSRRLVEQRLRNRMIEYLEIVSSFEDQRRYQAKAPIAYVPHEMINMWDDSSPLKIIDSVVFSEAERRAIRAFDAVLSSVVRNTPDPLPPLVETQALPEWDQLRAEGASALLVFQRRGKLPEDREA